VEVAADAEFALPSRWLAGTPARRIAKKEPRTTDHETSDRCPFRVFADDRTGCRRAD